MQRKMSHALCIVGVTLIVVREAEATVDELSNLTLVECSKNSRLAGEAFRMMSSLIFGSLDTSLRNWKYILYSG